MRNTYLVGAVGVWLLASACGRLGTGDDMFGDDNVTPGDGDMGDGDTGDGDMGDGDMGDGDMGDGDMGDGDMGDGDMGGDPGDGDGDLGGAPGDGDGDATGGLGGGMSGDGDGDGDIEPPDPSAPLCFITAPAPDSTTAFHGEMISPILVEPSSPQFSGIAFRATATDLEDGELSGESIAWFIEGDGVSGGDELLGFGSELIVEALPPGENKIVCQVVDSDENEGEDTVTLKVLSPVLYIYHPGTLDGPRPASEAIEFVAAGFDYEDGTLNSETFLWESNLDGVLGEGNGAYKLSPGVHTVTVKGKDSEQNSATANVTVTTVEVEILPPIEN
jgi:hypothetical protein